MAGLSPPERPPWRPENDVAGAGDRSRGQLLLVSGFALAVLLLTLAVALNAATYSESLSTRADGVDDADVRTVHYSVERGISGVIRATNPRQPINTNYTERKTLVREAVGNWTALVGLQAAADGAMVNVTVENTTKGTRVWQNESNRTLTDDSGNSTWTVANGVTSTRGFRMNVSRASLANDSCPSGCFTVVVNNSTTDWRMTLTGNNSTITVDVDGPNGSDTCSVQANHTEIDLSSGTLAGESCPLLSFADDIDGEYDVIYENGTEAEGTYALVVDESISMGSFTSPPGPHAHPVVWSAEVKLTYRTPNLLYQRTFWVAPGEDDA